MGCSTKIVPYHARWRWAFIEERDRIAVALGPLALRIEHHGSTSVVGLAAKPVIDIQISVGTLHPLDRYITPLAVLGYVHVPHQDDVFCPYFHTLGFGDEARRYDIRKQFHSRMQILKKRGVDIRNNGFSTPCIALHTRFSRSY